MMKRNFFEEIISCIAKASVIPPSGRKEKGFMTIYDYLRGSAQGPIPTSDLDLMPKLYRL